MSENKKHKEKNSIKFLKPLADKIDANYTISDQMGIRSHLAAVKIEKDHCIIINRALKPEDQVCKAASADNKMLALLSGVEGPTTLEENQTSLTSISNITQQLGLSNLTNLTKITHK